MKKNDPILERYDQLFKNMSKRLSLTSRFRAVDTRNRLLRQEFVYRLFSRFPDSFILTGGSSLELRLPDSRTTRDLDTITNLTRSEILSYLDEISSDSETPLTFSYEDDITEIKGVEGFSIWIAARINDRTLEKFKLDITTPKILPQADTVHAKIDNPFYRKSRSINANSITIETYLSRKLDAFSYTEKILRKGKVYQVNRHRYHDLADMAIIASSLPVRMDRLRSAIAEQWAGRENDVPTTFQLPGDDWTDQTWAAAQRKRSWDASLTLTKAFTIAERFFTPVLNAIHHDDPIAERMWVPGNARWSAPITDPRTRALAGIPREIQQLLDEMNNAPANMPLPEETPDDRTPPTTTYTSQPDHEL